MLILPAMMLSVAALQPGVWKASEYGDLALPAFKSAPFPHASRANGFQSGKTFYPRDPHYVDSTVGVFVPKGFKAGSRVNFVVHFHGFNNHVEQVFKQYDLEREMKLSGLNAVLLVPQGPRDVPDEDFGKLEHDPGSLEAMLKEAIAFLAKEGRVPANAGIGNVALTAHSGAYLVASRILGRNELPGKLTDVILFDSTYGSLPAVADWCAADKHRRLISICTQYLGFRNAQLIAMLQKLHIQPRVLLDEDLTPAEVAKRGPLIVVTATLAHDDVISKRDYFANWLHACRFGSK
ncbi:MAG: hypothetical protein ACYC96_13960 [Fimbriimonadaceae bacterium]